MEHHGREPRKPFADEQATDEINDAVNGRRYREALERICRHLETIAPSAYKMSTVWRIAKSALPTGDSNND